MMKKYIQIGPSKYKLETHTWSKKETSRGWHSEKGVISIREGMPKYMNAEVLLHEIMHGICYTFNLRIKEEFTEEQIVETMSTGLATVFCQNPWLLKYLEKGLLK